MDGLANGLSNDNGHFAAEAIMTTDVAVKEIAVEFEVGGKICKIGGIAKGSGMIHPNMATMLVFITTDCAISSEMLSKALGRKLDFSYSLRMPDNYVVLYDPSPKEKAQKFLAHADKELESVCDDINLSAKKRAGSTDGEIKSLFVSKLYNICRTTKKFYADDKCVACGLCAKNCPDNAIEIRNGKPVWTKSKCQHCTACINRCPKEAIQFGKGTETRRRYNYDKTLK